MPLIKFTANRISKALLLNAIASSLIAFVTILAKTVITDTIHKFEINHEIKNANNNKRLLTNEIHKIHQHIVNLKSKLILNTADKNKITKLIKSHENKIIKLTERKNSSIYSTSQHIHTIKEIISHKKDILYKTDSDATRKKIIGEITELHINLKNLTNKIVNYKLPYRNLIIWTITLIVGFISAFFIFIILYLLFGFGGGMLSPCNSKFSCKW